MIAAVLLAFLLGFVIVRFFKGMSVSGSDEPKTFSEQVRAFFKKKPRS